MKRLALTLGVAFALAGSASAEQFYKWQDESGVWHYSEKPPKDKQSQAVSISPGEAAAANAAAKPGEAAPDADAEKKAAELAKLRSDNCARSKFNVTTLETNDVVTVARDGKDVQLNPEERLDALKKARQQVEIFCAPAAPQAK